MNASTIAFIWLDLIRLCACKDTGGQMYLFPYAPCWGRGRRHRHEVDALWRRRCRLLIIVALRSHNYKKHISGHFIWHHLSTVLCSEVGVLEYYTTTQSGLQRLVALLTPEVLI